MKKIIYIVAALTLISGLTSFFRTDTSTDSDLETNSVITFDDNDTNQNQTIELTSFDDLYSRADEVSKEALELEGSQKISFITKKVTADITADLDKSIILDALSYVITEYENEKFNLNAPVNLYITRVLDKQLDKYSDMLDADEMSFDMFQICKDIIRMNSENMAETNHSISANEDQINKVLESVKSSLK